MPALCRGTACPKSRLPAGALRGSRGITSHSRIYLHLSIAHMDCDAFFIASVEKRDNPH